MRDIFNDAWSNNWGFVPFTENEFTDAEEMLTKLADDDFMQIAEIIETIGGVAYKRYRIFEKDL